MDEDIAGRARVHDTPELKAYYGDIARLDAGALWTVANTIEPWEPSSASVPMLWRYEQLRPHVLRSLDLVTPERAGRRVVYLVNPGRQAAAAAVGGLYTGLQVMNPGEKASAHRHSTSALRFIMEGSGAYTIVDGQRVTLGRNDFVLTPNGTWHEHGVSADGSVCIWQDGLDIPMVNMLEANFFEVHPELAQRVDPNTEGVPFLKYEWEPTYATLREAASEPGSPFDGVLRPYLNSITGGPVMSTIGAAMQLLRPGEHTRSHRHTGSAVYQVAKGSGFSIIAGQRFDWAERDIFCVPSWAWHEHANNSPNEDSCLFQFNDLPVMHALGLYREQAGT